jgi:hypothetical protein
MQTCERNKTRRDVWGFQIDHWKGTKVGAFQDGQVYDLQQAHLR